MLRAWKGLTDEAANTRIRPGWGTAETRALPTFLSAGSGRADSDRKQSANQATALSRGQNSGLPTSMSASSGRAVSGRCIHHTRQYRQILLSCSIRISVNQRTAHLKVGGQRPGRFGQQRANELEVGRHWPQPLDREIRDAQRHCQPTAFPRQVHIHPKPLTACATSAPPQRDTSA